MGAAALLLVVPLELVPPAGGHGYGAALLVAITPQPAARVLIRRGWRLANRLRGEFYVLHVKNRELSGNQQKALQSYFALAEELGAEVIVVPGRDVVEEIVRFANERQITHVVIGAGHPNRWEEIRKGSLVDRLLRRTDHIDVLIVSEQRKRATPAP